MTWSRKPAADKALSTTRLSGYISLAKSGIGGQDSFGKGPGVKCTACGLNISRAAGLPSNGVRGPAARDEILCGTKDSRRDCSAVCPGGRGSDGCPQCAFLF